MTRAPDDANPIVNSGDLVPGWWHAVLLLVLVLAAILVTGALIILRVFFPPA